MSKSMTTSNKNLTGADLLKAIHKYPQYKDMSDYAIKKALWKDGKPALVSDLQKEYNKLSKRKVSKEKTGKVSKEKKKAETKSKPKVKKEKKSKKGSRDCPTPSCKAADILLIWDKEDWMSNKSQPTVALVAPTLKELDKLLKEYYMENRNEPEFADMSNEDFKVILDSSELVTETCWSPKLDTVYHIYCMKGGLSVKNLIKKNI